MSDDELRLGAMGTFSVDIAIESHQRRGNVARIANVLVDTGAEATWLPREALDSLGVVPEGREQYQMADGRVLERELGFVIVHVAGKRTSDDVVFAEPGDLSLLGARSLQGLNLRVDARAKRLVPAGPRITAASDYLPSISPSLEMRRRTSATRGWSSGSARFHRSMNSR
jgi:predicted aspartyl protease